MIVAEAMTAIPATAEVTASVRSVMRKLMELDVRHLPILDDGKLVGIVSDRDLRGVMSNLVAEGFESARPSLSAPVANVMSTDLVTVDPEMELGEAVDLMIEHRVGALPVVTATAGELVGIVSYVDVLRAARDEI